MPDNQELIRDTVSNLVNNPDTVELLNSLIAKRKEESLDLSGLGISPIVTGIIAQAIAKNPNLKELNLFHNDIGYEGAKALADALKTNTSITVLSLEGNDIGDEGAKALADALKTNTSITALSLAGNDIDDEGAKALADALKTNTSITALRLTGNYIGYEGAKALADALKTNTSITALNLVANNIGDEEQTLIDINRMRLRNIRLVSPEEVTNRKKISERFADKLGLLPELGPEITAFLYPIDTHENLSFVAKVKREKEEEETTQKGAGLT